MEYKFKPGMAVGVPAQVVGEELERIRQEHGSLKASGVVEAARPKDAPLHPAFEWSDRLAATEYRLVQARTLIRSVTVAIEQQESVTAYVHVSVPRSREGEYHPIHEIVAQPDKFTLAIVECNRRLAAAQRQVDDLMMLARAGDAPDKLAQIALAAQALAAATSAIESISVLH